MIFTRQNLIQKWRKENIIFFEETIWTSSIQQSDLPKVRDFLTRNDFEHVDLSIVRPQSNELTRIKWKYHYDSTGQCISTNYQNKIEANSNHLKLTIGLKEKHENQECQNETISIINTLRLVFGVPIAKELLFVNHYQKEDIVGTTNSEEGFASYFLSQSLNMFPDMADIKVKSIPVESSILLDTALQQKFPVECFVLMWTAFEAIIHALDIPGQKNGDKRRNYFEKELGSPIVNNEVKRLYQDVRCNIFKEAKFSTNRSIEDENWSLYSVLQLTIMDDCPPRMKFLKGYEEILKAKM